MHKTASQTSEKSRLLQYRNMLASESEQMGVVPKDTMGSKEKAYESTAQTNISAYLTIAIHIFTAGFVLFILYLCLTNELVFFTWHPVLFAIGWILLMTEGILMLAPNNPLTKGLTHKSKVQLHWIFQAVGVTCGAVGFAVIYINKNIKEKQHFVSWHGLIGLISVISCAPACVSGIVALYNISFKNYVKPVNSKLIHRICGILTFLIGSTTILLSLYTNWFQRKVNEAVTVMWFVLMAMICVWAVSHGAIVVFRRLRSLL